MCVIWWGLWFGEFFGEDVDGGTEVDGIAGDLDVFADFDALKVVAEAHDAEGSGVCGVVVAFDGGHVAVFARCDGGDGSGD